MLKLDKWMGGDGFESPTRCLQGLYVGGQGEARDLGLLRSLGVTHIVNSAIQLPCYFEEEGHFAYFHLELHDAADETILEHLHETSDFIHRAISLGGACYVHCIAGMSRSVTICLAYMLKYGGMTLQQAWARIKKRRWIIDPNKTFLYEVAKFEVQVRGCSSVQVYGPWLQSPKWMAVARQYPAALPGDGQAGRGGGSSVCVVQ